jgi:hypothetical protein
LVIGGEDEINLVIGGGGGGGGSGRGGGGDWILNEE